MKKRYLFGRAGEKIRLTRSNFTIRDAMFPHKLIKLPIVLLLFILVISSCQSSEELPATPAVTSEQDEASTTIVPTTATVLPPTVTSELAASNTPVAPTSTVLLPPTSTPTIDVAGLDLLVFDLQSKRVGRLSLDGTQYQPLTQVPKLDVASLDLGLFTEDSGYFVSPNGRYLTTIVGYDQLILADVDADQRSSIARIGAGFWLGWAHNSQSFAYREGESKVCLYQLLDQATSCFPDFEGKVVAAAWSLDDSKLALSVAGAGELPPDAPGVVPAVVWLLDVATQQAEQVAEQALPFEGANNFLVWTSQGLIVNRLLADSPAGLLAGDSVTLLPIPVVTASPSGNYVVYEDGRIAQADTDETITQLTVCAEALGQNLQIVWSHNENSVAYTVDCATTADTNLGIYSLSNPDLSWTLAIPNQFRLIGWSYDDSYLFFRNQTSVERLAATPNAVFETLTGSMFLIDVLDRDPESLEP